MYFLEATGIHGSVCLRGEIHCPITCFEYIFNAGGQIYDILGAVCRSHKTLVYMLLHTLTLWKRITKD